MLAWRKSWHLLTQLPHRGNNRLGWVVVFLLTAVVALTTVSLMTAAIATDRWVASVPKLLVPGVVGNRTTNGESKDPPGSKPLAYSGAKGYVNFGLFHGYKRLDNGLGARYGELWVHCIAWRNLCGWEWSWTTTSRYQMDRNPSAAAAAGDDAVDEAKDVALKLLYTIDDSLQAYDNLRLRNDSLPAQADELRRYSSASDFGLFNCGLWASTVAFVSLSILAGLVVFVLALLNLGLTAVLGKVIRPAWIFAWMGVLECSMILAIITYTVLFCTNFQRNILTGDDKELYTWTTDNSTTTLDLSFFLVVAAAILNCICMFVSCIPLLECTKCRKVHKSKSQMDGIIMMY